MDDVKPSKSQVKRELIALQDLGERLIELSWNELNSIIDDNDLLEALKEYQSIKSYSALKRQKKRVGKLISKLDENQQSLILQKLEQGIQSHEKEKQLFHYIEKWRERLIDEGDEAVNQLYQQHNNFDPQERGQLRQWIRNAIKERMQQSSPKHSRIIFKYLRSHISESENV